MQFNLKFKKLLNINKTILQMGSRIKLEKIINLLNVVFYVVSWCDWSGSKDVHTATAYPGFCTMKPTRSSVTRHWTSIPPPSILLGCPNSSPVPIYTPGWRDRGTARVKCLTQEHNTVTPARARTWTARSGCVQHANH